MRLHIIGRSKAFDLFPRTHKGKNRCVLRKKHALINSREPLLKSDINLEQSSHVETVALLGKQNGKPLPDENIKELAAYLGSGNAKPDDTIEIRVDADKVYEILDREKEAKESK